MIIESLKVWKNLIFNVNQDMTVAVVIAIEAIANQSPPLPSPEQKEIGGFRGMWTYGLLVSAALLYQLKKEAPYQRAKKVVSDSLGQVDFAIRLVIFVLNLPDGQVLFFGEIQITEGL